MLRVMFRLLFCLMFCLTPIGAFAGKDRPAKGSKPFADSLYDTPVYNAETKSYFELVRLDKWGKFVDHHLKWNDAKVAAEKKTYKGARGHLAKVSSLSVNSFLLYTFQPQTRVWIGLVFNCTTGMWSWADGQPIDRNSYTNWHPVKWNWDEGQGKTDMCGGPWPYVSVAYFPVSDGFRWGVKRHGKGYGAMFVEYPTGGE